MNREYPELDTNNAYAKNLEGVEIHISEAESGANGYYCLGCDQELQAVMQTKQNRISYFRHAPTDVMFERKCTYSNETHRHQLAKRILLQNKFIKVPPVYKFPPNKGEGLTYVLQESQIVEAHTVKVETTFYEDSDGNIKWGPNAEVDDKFLLVKPDIAFLNAQGEPILFIELVATHALDAEKSAKLKRLGINTIQVKLPRDSPESIERSLRTTEHSKWIYNHVESNTEYIQISEAGGETISSIDDIQRKLFEESFKCRQAQVRNLIRTITKCLESQQYRDIERSFGLEISRVEANTKDTGSRLDDIREEHRERASKGFEAQIEDLSRQDERLTAQERDFERSYKDLEERYKRKKSELELEERQIAEEEGDVDLELSGKVEDESLNGGSIERRRRENQRLAEELGRLIRLEQDRSERISRDREQLPEKFDKLARRENGEIEKLVREEEGLSEEFRRKEESLPREFESEEITTQRELEAERERANEIIVSKNGSGNTPLHHRIRRLLASRESLDDIEQALINYRRYRQAWDAFRSGAYESWIE